MNPIARIAGRLRRDQKGVSAVEFALIAPILILFYFGLAEATQVMMAERKTIRTASAIGDLVAQYSTLTSSNVDDIMKLGEVLMKPYPTSTQLKICINSIEADNAGKMTVGWTRSTGGATCKVEGADVPAADVPADLIAKNQSLIMARVTYEYLGPTNKVIKTSPTFVKTFYLRPRKSQTVICSDCT